MAEIPKYPEGEGAAQETGDVVELARRAQAAAAAAVQARQRDVEQKLLSIPELRAKQEQVASQQVEVASIVKSFEDIRSQRELISEEQQAYETALSAQEMLASAMAGYERALDKPMGDAAVRERMEGEAHAENKKLQEKEQLRQDFERFIANLDAQIVEYAKLQAQKDEYEKMRMNIADQMGKYINNADDRTLAEKFGSLGRTGNIRAERLAECIDYLQTMLTKLGVFERGKRKTYTNILAYLDTSEVIAWTKAIKPDPDKIIDQLAEQYRALRPRGATVGDTHFMWERLRDMQREAKETYKQYTETHDTKYFDRSIPEAARVAVLGDLESKRVF